MAYSADYGSLATSATSNPVDGVKANVLLSGTWVGTVSLEVFSQNIWVATGKTWTANIMEVIDSASPQRWRLNFTRTSGTLVYDLQAAL